MFGPLCVDLRVVSGMEMRRVDLHRKEQDGACGGGGVMGMVRLRRTVAVGNRGVSWLADVGCFARD